MRRPASLSSVAFSPDGRTLAVVGADGSTRLWDVATQQEIGTPMTAGPAPVYALAFSPDGTHAGHRRRRREHPAVGRRHPAGDRHPDDGRPGTGLRARVQPGRHARWPPPPAARPGGGTWPSRPACRPPPVPSRVKPSPRSSGLATLEPSRSSRSAPRASRPRPGRPGTDGQVGDRMVVRTSFSGRRGRHSASRASRTRPRRRHVRIVLAVLGACSVIAGGTLAGLTATGAGGHPAASRRRGQRRQRRDRGRAAERDLPGAGPGLADVPDGRKPGEPGQARPDAGLAAGSGRGPPGSVRDGRGLVPVGPGRHRPGRRLRPRHRPHLGPRPRRAAGRGERGQARHPRDAAGRTRPGQRHRPVVQRPGRWPSR